MARSSTARTRTHRIANDVLPRTPLKLVYSADNPDASIKLERGAARHLVAFHRGYMYALNRQLEKALGWFQECIELKPDFAEAHYNAGWIFAETNKLADALTAFRRASEIKPNFADAYINLGWTLGALGHSAEAVAAYDEVLTRFGAAPEPSVRELVAKALVNKGVGLAALGRSDDAIAVYDDLLDRFGTASELPLREKVASALFNKGVTLGKLGRDDDAIAVYDDLLDRFGTASELPLREQVAKALFSKGGRLGALGRSEEARGTYRKFLALAETFTANDHDEDWQHRIAFARPKIDEIDNAIGESNNPSYTENNPPPKADDTSQLRIQDGFNIAVKKKVSDTLELRNALAVARYEVLARHVDLLNPRLAEDERLRRAERLLKAYKRLRKENPDFRDTGDQLRAARRIQMTDFRQRKRAKLQAGAAAHI